MKILLLLPLTFALFGWGKYPSQQQAKNACNEWVENGPEYYSKAGYRDISARERWEKTGTTRYKWEKSSQFDKFDDDRAKEMKKVNGIWITGLRPYRECKWERTTNQYLGIQPKSMPSKAVKSWEEVKDGREGRVVKNFRY